MINKTKYIKHIYETITSLLKEKAEITAGEVTHLKALIKYIIEQDSNISHKNEKTKNNESLEKTQFFIDAKNLYDALGELEKKIETYIKDIDYIKKERVNKINEYNNHLSLIPLLDCMQERSYSIAEKLEYINQSYENLIEPYTSLYLPMPIVSKRIKTSNLMLYFNSILNENYKKLKEDFFSITNDKNNEDTGVFSTWDFSTADHVKSISDTHKVFISLSFWFYEKQIFYPIAFHEIAHSLYYMLSEDEKKSKYEILLTDEEKNSIKKILYGSSEESEELKIDSAYISAVYQDIVADFSAFSLSGVSYIFALFYSTFFFNIHQNFYIDLAITKIDKKIRNNDKRCINQEENVTILDWGTTKKTSNKNLNSMYIRLSLLLKLAKESEDIKIDKFEKELKGIELILNLIYPKSKLNISTFEDIITNFAKQNKQYQVNKYYTFILLEEFERIVFVNKKLHKKAINVFKKIKMFDEDNKKDINNNYKNNGDNKKEKGGNNNERRGKFYNKINDFLNSKCNNEIVQKLINEYKNKNYAKKENFIEKIEELLKFYYIRHRHNKKKIDEENLKNKLSKIVKDLKNKKNITLLKDIESQYNLYWYLKLMGCNHIGRILRLHNLFELHIEPDVELKDTIYELIYFKYHYKKDEKNPLLDFEENRVNNIKNYLMKKEDFLCYALGPYDIALLTKRTTAEIDKGLKNYIENNSFFADRHALFLLKEFDNKNTQNNSRNNLDIIFSIDIKGELKGENTKKFCNKIKSDKRILSYLIKYSQNSKFFASMGNENFILYVHKFDIKKLQELINELLKIEDLSKMSTTLLINEESKSIKIDKKYLELEMLCKVRNDKQNYKENINKIKTKLKELNDEDKNLNIHCSLKFGVYDISIKTAKNETDISELIEIAKQINEYVEDIQIEPCINVDLD